MKLSNRVPVTWYTPVLLVSAYIVLALNTKFWSAWLGISGFPSTGFTGTVAILALIFSFFSMTLFVFSHSTIQRPVLIIVIWIAAVVHYFSANYGTIIDDTMIQNLFETDTLEAKGLLSGKLVLHIVLYAAIPSIILIALKIKPISHKKWLAQCLVVVTALIGVASSSVFFGYKELSIALREHREIRQLVNPSYAVYSFAKYASHRPDSTPQTIQTIAVGLQPRLVRKNDRHRLLVLVVGETARADHFSLNGYDRNTNPALSKLNVVSLTNAWSCGTSTAESLPCMFSDLNRDDYSRSKAAERENLLDVLAKVGVNVSWIDNNSGSKNVADRISYLHTSDFPESLRQKYCTGGECYDEILVDALAERLPTISADTVIVLHLMGQHGPNYSKRYPPQFSQFEPTCDRKDIFNCSQESIVNAYDNSIRYTDYVVAKLIDRVKDKSDNVDSVVIYVSDHGESLGESGIYLHGAPWRFAPDAQKRIPFIIWTSPNAKQSISDCLLPERDAEVSHDSLFPSVLSLFSDEDSYDRNLRLNIFEPCGNAPDRAKLASLATSATANN